MSVVPCPECGRPATVQTYGSVKDGKQFNVTQYDCENTIKKRHNPRDPFKAREGMHQAVKFYEELSMGDGVTHANEGVKGSDGVVYPVRKNEKPTHKVAEVRVTPAGIEADLVALPTGVGHCELPEDKPPAPFPDALPEFRFACLDYLLQLTHEGREAYIALIRQASNVAEFKAAYGDHMEKFRKLEAEFRERHAPPAI